MVLRKKCDLKQLLIFDYKYFSKFGKSFIQQHRH